MYYRFIFLFVYQLISIEAHEFIYGSSAFIHNRSEEFDNVSSKNR